MFHTILYNNNYFIDRRDIFVCLTSLLAFYVREDLWLNGLRPSRPRYLDRIIVCDMNLILISKYLIFLFISHDRKKIPQIQVKKRCNTRTINLRNHVCLHV